MPAVRVGICVLGAFILTMAAILHVYWALGGNFGQSVSAPELSGRAVFHFPRYASALVALGLLGGAMVLAARSGAFGSSMRTPLTATAARLMAIGFALRAIGDFRYLGFFKRVHGTPFANYDTWFYSPLFVWLAITCATASLD